MAATSARTIELDRIVEGLPDLVAVLEIVGDDVLVRAANDVVVRAVGIELADMVDRPLRELQPQSVAVAGQQVVAEALRRRGPVRRELELVMRSRRRTLDVTVIPLPDADDQVLAVMHDLTELHEIAAALDETQAIARIGHWAWDIQADEITWTDELYRIFGLEPDAFEATYDALMRLLHPEDREEVGATIEAALADRSAYTHQHRIVRPGGEVRVISSLGHVVTDEDGEPIRIAGTAQDITERIHAQEEALRLREAQSRHEQGLELNDNVMQGLAVTRLALAQGDDESALRALDRTIEAARDIIRSLLEARAHAHGGLQPGDLVRSRGALETEDA